MNHFKENITSSESEVGKEPFLKKEPLQKQATEPSSAESNNFLKTFLSEGIMTKEKATDILPFVIFCTVLGMIYIANSHMAVRNIYKIDKLEKEVKDLKADYQSLNAELSFKSQFSEVEKKVDTLGIKELVEPPQKIIVEQVDEH
ncbi:MAG: hypothetical protein K2Q03_11115 [Sphingobacteriaceae bacterium]|nr:hypothetical protein [Sphingobacteriaceae bacterium]